MGAAKKDYLRVAPPHSFIHVDDFLSPKLLADYLHNLGKRVYQCFYFLSSEL